MNEDNVLLVLCRKRRDGQAALKRRVELRIIFNDEGLPALRPVKQKPSPGGAEYRARGELAGRCHISEFRLRTCAHRRLDANSVLVGGYRPRAQTVRPDHLPHFRIAWILDPYLLTRPGERAQGKIDRSLRA